LPGEWSKAGCDEEEPGQEFTTVIGRTAELSRLVGEIKKDRAGIEHARFLSARAVGVDDRRHLAVRIDLPERGLVLLPFARIHGDNFVWQSCLFEKERDFQGIWRWVVVEPDHLGFSP